MTGPLQHIAFISMPGGGEWIILLVVGLLIFGRRLPEVARNLGKSVNEFKKGIREFQESADEVVRDVDKATSDVVSEANDASGMNDYGYYEPTSDGSPYEGSESGAVSDDAEPYGAPESTDATEDTPLETGEVASKQDEGDPCVEPMK